MSRQVAMFTFEFELSILCRQLNGSEWSWNQTRWPSFSKLSLLVPVALVAMLLWTKYALHVLNYFQGPDMSCGIFWICAIPQEWWCWVEMKRCGDFSERLTRTATAKLTLKNFSGLLGREAKQKRWIAWMVVVVDFLIDDLCHSYLYFCVYHFTFHNPDNREM